MKIVSFDWLVEANDRQAGILVKEYPGGYELKMISAMHAGQVAIFLKNCMKNIEVKELKFVLPEVKKMKIVSLQSVGLERIVMRDIKFRAWDKKSRIWLDDDEYVIKPDSGLVSEIDYADGYVVIAADNHDVVLEQNTGLKDKNGVEIYENDIVRCSRGCPHKVVWEEERGGMFGGGMPGWYLSGLGDGYAWTNSEEVIGNIHENANLLVNDTDRISPDDIGNDIHEFLHVGDK